MKLNARTAWGDSASHYAARHGTVCMLRFFLLFKQRTKKEKNEQITTIQNKKQQTKNKIDQKGLQDMSKSTLYMQ